ncbi:FAD-dependent oxidoreductase [Legionella sp. CNM-1927-20]|uniref:FAD-dependent oxidoreductase n=1 Tax=Legionella sp. CNM-1927-20 TaxID=3422221 RepID=UPI00403AFFB7
MKSSLTIIGAGASGLLSALVLAKYYDDILLIDRYWPDEKGVSQGTPQSYHLHVLLAEGQQLLASLLPDVWRQLTFNLLPVVDWGKETWWKTPQGLLARNNCSVKTYLFSRQWLNQVLWSQRQQQQNIRTLTATLNNWRMVDGKIKQLQFKDGSSIPITGDVIDARGRSSNLQRQLSLKSLQVKNQYRYFSTQLRQHDWQTDLGIQQVYIQACPKKQPIGLVLSPIEGQQLILTLIDTSGTIKTDAHKESIIKSLFKENQLGRIHCTLKDWVPYANLNNKRLIIEYHKWPKNLLAIGDSICYQNPVYGQGLTVILKQLHVLKQQERRNWSNQKQLHRCNWLPWLMASHQDKQCDKDTTFQWLLQKLLHRAVIDPVVGKVFIQILHQKISPLCLLNPKLLAKLMWKHHYD